MRTIGTSQQLERRRRRAIDLLQRGISTTEVALRLKVDPRSVRRWRDAYEHRGDVGLLAKPTLGKHSLLTSRQRTNLLRRLRKGAKANGFETDLWTCPRITELIEQSYNVCYHVDHMPRLLAGLGFSYR